MYMFINSNVSTSVDSILRTFECVHAFNQKLANDDELLPSDINKIYSVSEFGVFNAEETIGRTSKELFRSFFVGNNEPRVKAILRKVEEELKVAMMYHDPFIAD